MVCIYGVYLSGVYLWCACIYDMVCYRGVYLCVIRMWDLCPCVIHVRVCIYVVCIYGVYLCGVYL